MEPALAMIEKDVMREGLTLGTAQEELHAAVFATDDGAVDRIRKMVPSRY